MWRWFGLGRKPKDPLVSFVKAQRKLGRKVKTSGLSEKDKKELTEKYRKDLAKLLENLGNFLTPLEIKRISLVYHKKDRRSIWFSPASKKEPAKVVINLAQALLVTPQVIAEIEQVIEKTKPIKVEEVLVPRVPVASEKEAREIAAERPSEAFSEKPLTPPIKTHHQQGREYALAGDFTRAIEEYNKGLELWPNSEELFWDRQLAYWRRYDEKGDPNDREVAKEMETERLEREGFSLEYWIKMQLAKVDKRNVIDFESD